MFWNKKKEEEPSVQRKLVEFSDKIAELAREQKQMRDDIDKMEIKVLESRKVYGRKLKNLLGEEESSKEEEEMQEAKSINNPVILPYNGAFK